MSRKRKKHWLGRLIFRLRLRLGRKKYGFYYINGPELLPQPLTREEEAEVVAVFESGGEGADVARSTLIERNLRLVVFIAKRFENSGVGIEDLISIGTLGLVKAVNTFRSDKNIKLATYASRCIENEILMYLRKISGRHEVSLDEPLNTDWDGNELLLSDILGSDEDSVSAALEEEEEKRALYRAVEQLNPREKMIIAYRFGLFGKKELTQKEVADLLGISQSYISRLEKRILAKLRKAMEGVV